MYIYTAPICKLNALRVHREEEEGRLEGETWRQKTRKKLRSRSTVCVKEREGLGLEATVAEKYISILPFPFCILQRGITTTSNTVSAHHVYPSLEKVRLLLQLIHDSSFQVLASITTYAWLLVNCIKHTRRRLSLHSIHMHCIVYKLHRTIELNTLQAAHDSDIGQSTSSSMFVNLTSSSRSNWTPFSNTCGRERSPFAPKKATASYG